MRLKKIIFFVLVLAVAVGGWYVWKEFNRTNKDLTRVKAAISVTADDIIKDYELSDSIANFKYLGKIVEVTGNVKKMEKEDKSSFAIVLGDSNSLSSVRCLMDTIHLQDAALIVEGTSVVLRGACTGFNKDEMGLGSDVILNRCVVVQKKKIAK